MAPPGKPRTSRDPAGSPSGTQVLGVRRERYRLDRWLSRASYKRLVLANRLPVDEGILCEARHAAQDTRRAYHRDARPPGCSKIALSEDLPYPEIRFLASLECRCHVQILQVRGGPARKSLLGCSGPEKRYGYLLRETFETDFHFHSDRYFIRLAVDYVRHETWTLF